MRKLALVCCAVFMIIALVGCGAVETETTDITDEAVVDVAEKEVTNIAVYDDCQLELKEATTYTTNDGQKMIRVSAVYINNQTEPLYALCSFVVRAFQNDKEITECSDINGDEESLTLEVKNGETIEVQYVFELTDESPVEVLVGTPTADEATIGKQTYLIEE